ncbi:response regulator [Desulfotignum phosphitoxidans]|uniref:Response regulator receiver domain-containing protein n=1 Tax=Desulfotignum phosphitoxidans DSM 13687 TaxID=1286635 RepID=S0G6Z6_9BACT|nr:response regulator receiver domain-containing protein [Desulfotignum phosphitoxidans DSM 13687]
MEKMKLMLVEDEERYLQTTAKLLKKRRIKVVTAQSGAQALDLLKTHDVHVVILDIKMPGMDGFKTLKAIKTLYPPVEVIFLTGHATMDSAIEGLQSGAFDYVMKPADIDDIVTKAYEAFEKRQRLDEKIRGLTSGSKMDAHNDK